MESGSRSRSIGGRRVCVELNSGSRFEGRLYYTDNFGIIGLRNEGVLRARSIGIKGDESQLGPCDNFYVSIEFRASDVKIHYPLSKTAALRYDAVTSSLPASSVAHGSVITMNNITYEGKIAADSRIVLENVSTYDSKNRESEEIYQRIQFGCFDFKVELFVMNASCFQRKASTLIHSGSAIIQSHYPTAASTASTTLEEQTKTLYQEWRQTENKYLFAKAKLKKTKNDLQRLFPPLPPASTATPVSLPQPTPPTLPHQPHLPHQQHQPHQRDKGRHNREDKGRNNIGDLGRNSRGDKGRHNRGDLGRNNNKDKGRHNSKG
ncbi:hypothetical protein OROMI_028587 [Orobanche minor]